MIDGHVALAAAGYIKAGQHRDALQQRGFAGTVFADDDGDWPVEMQFEFVPQERQTERIGLGVGDGCGIEPDAPKIRCRHVDLLVSFFSQGRVLGSPEGSAHPIRVVDENQEQKENRDKSVSAQNPLSVTRRATHFRFTEVMSSPQNEKYFALSETRTGLSRLHPVPTRGALAIVTNAGRGAMDARGALDEGRRSVRQRRVVLTPRCWRLRWQ